MGLRLLGVIVMMAEGASAALAAPSVGAALAPQSAVIEGTVSKVFDGDSLLLQPAAPAAAVQVRLLHIDAPEICQSGGPQSRDALAELVLNKDVLVQTVGRDSYGRVIGRVRVGAVDASIWQVEQGHAWSARSKWDRGPLVKQERMAKALSRGLHSEPRPLLPKDFRARNGPCPR